MFKYLFKVRKKIFQKNFNILKLISQKEKNNKIKEIIENYIKFIEIKNEETKSSSKNFYIIVKYDLNEVKKEMADNYVNESIAINFLNECFFKIKESLSRCGNVVYDINSKKESKEILNSFFNPKIKKIGE